MFEFVLPVLFLGACIGSFLNVVIYRLPRQVSFITKRSRCLSCGKKLQFFDLIPILSWISLKGKCRYCRNKISFRYPLVEFLTSLLFLLIFKFSYFNINSLQNILVLISGWILISYLIILTFIDIDHMILPNNITFSGSIVGLVMITINDLIVDNNGINNFSEHLKAYFFGLIGIYLFSLIMMWIFKKPALGGGDTKLFAMSGAWLGLAGLEVTIALSFLIGGIFSLIAFTFKFIKKGDYIPFGPFICFSTFMVWLLGPNFWIESLGDIFWWKYL